MQDTAGRAPRLRMGHLLVWVVGCAVGFAAYRSITPTRITNPRGLAIVTGYSLAMGTAFGTILTGCGLLAYRRWRGDTSCPSRAGHWLLLLGLAAAPADVAAVVAYHLRAVQDPSYPVTPYLAQFSPGGASTWPSMHHHAVGWGVGAMVALGFALTIHRRLERRWRAVFLVYLLAGAILAAGYIAALGLALVGVSTRRLNFLLVHVYAGSAVLSALAILAAIVGDTRSGAPRDGLHRLGVGAWLAIAAIQLVMYVLYLGLW
jgi:hypothetical protein